MDTECTTNVLAKYVFDRLPEAAKQLMQPHMHVHGTLADRSALPFYDVVKLPCRVRNLDAFETFIISPCKEDAILSMPFLVQQDCTMKFNTPTVRFSRGP